MGTHSVKKSLRVNISLEERLGPAGTLQGEEQRALLFEIVSLIFGILSVTDGVGNWDRRVPPPSPEVPIIAHEQDS